MATSLERRRIALRGHVPAEEGVQFLYAEVRADDASPLAVVHYALDGREQEYGLRLDLDKQIFLDRPVDPRQARAVERATQSLIDILSAYL